MPTSVQVVEAVIANMKWPDHLNQKFRSIRGCPDSVRLAGWDLQDALDWMDTDLGDEGQTRAAANFMIDVLRLRYLQPSGFDTAGTSDSGANAPSKGARQHSCSPPPPSSMPSYSVINMPDQYARPTMSFSHSIFVTLWPGTCLPLRSNPNLLDQLTV